MEFNDIHLIPRKVSRIKSRSSVDLKTEFKGLELSLPIISAPMDTVGGKEICHLLGNWQILNTLHRFSTEEKRKNKFLYLRERGSHKYTFVSVGIKEQNFIDNLYNIGVRNFLVDTANGFNSSLEPIIEHIKKKPKTKIIVGNVASAEGYLWLASQEVDAIRVGIGTGSMCTTSVMTGVGQSLPDTIKEIVEAKGYSQNMPLIIADGGIRTVGDIAKSLYLGADLIMLGRMFAGTSESEGSVLGYDNKLFKVYRGLASFGVQEKQRKKPYYVEGDETIVSYKGSATKILEQIDAGLRSSLSYMAARYLSDFKQGDK